VTKSEARREAARRGHGWTIRRDARRLGGWYVRSPLPPRVSTKKWAALVREVRGRCMLCRRRRALVREHNHRTGRLRWPTCSLCNCALGMLGRAGVRSVQAMQLWAVRAGIAL
jgi:hypothetical protein